GDLLSVGEHTRYVGVNTGNGGNLQGASQDSSMRRGSPNNGADTQNGLGIKACGVGGGEIMSNQNNRCLSGSGCRHACLTIMSNFSLFEQAYHTSSHVANVGGTCGKHLTCQLLQFSCLLLS